MLGTSTLSQQLVPLKHCTNQLVKTGEKKSLITYSNSIYLNNSCYTEAQLCKQIDACDMVGGLEKTKDKRDQGKRKEENVILPVVAETHQKIHT